MSTIELSKSIKIVSLDSFKICALIGLVILSAILSVSLGPVSIGFSEVVKALFLASDAVTTEIVNQIRLPRTLLSLAVGAMLGLAGAVLQGFLRNPLADPAILGASNAAALGAVTALYFGYASSFALALPILSICTALIAMAGLVAFAHYLPQFQHTATLTLILCGVAVGSVAGALISLLLNLSPNPFAAMEITFWLLGSFEDRSMKHVFLVFPLIGIGLLLLVWDARALDALSLGEEVGQSLGVDVRLLTMRIIIGVAIGVGAAVAVSGAIGFIGLVIPHISRYLFGSQPSRLLLPSALLGAVVLTLADILVRLVPTTNELKIGVLTALIGAPFLVYIILFSRGRSGWTSQ